LKIFYPKFYLVDEMTDIKFAIEAVKAGCFQNVIRANGTMKQLNEHQRRIRNILVQHAQGVPETIRVYRGIRDIPRDVKVLDHPIPFSTSLNLGFVCGWLYDVKNPRILIFDLPPYYPHIKVEDDDEDEIIIPNGIIHVYKQVWIFSYARILQK
jgi:hypothetical protein